MSQLEVRRAREDDRPAVLDLMSTTLGWRAGDENDTLFRWKHDEGVFGRSPAWVAVSGGQVVGFRTFMRWEFHTDGGVVTAVRAVDTATHPSHQGRGIFRTLTLSALEELRGEGVELVFNTPNDQSRPGYLKMGWVPVGVLPVALRPRHAAGVLRVVRARTPAHLWSEEPPGGEPVAVLADPAVDSLLQAQAREPAAGFATRRSGRYLRWRYGLSGLQYRVFRQPAGFHDGFVVFRVRRRGPALECAVVELVALRGRRGAGALVRGALTASGADYAVALRSPGVGGMLPVPRQGPLLVARPLAPGAVVPPAGQWRLSLGDVELF